MLPLSRPAAATTAIFAFLGAVGRLPVCRDFYQRRAVSPASTSVYTLIASNAGPVSWPEVMAASLILGLPTVLAVVFVQRYIRTGLSAGGLVG